MRIIFHHPLPLDEQAKSASGIRPVRMLEAFRQLGCEVDLVTGYARERKQQIRRIKKAIRSGVTYAFIYSESSTMPTILTEKHHLPVSPFLDVSFFRFCQKHNIPSGLFYRDIYWRFDHYGKKLNFLKRELSIAAYWFDLLWYQKYLNRLYLPSQEMSDYVPVINRDRHSSLPPGHNVDLHQSHPSSATPVKEINIFYVGGMSEHYQMHELFEAVRQLSWVKLLVCTREKEWNEVRHQYLPLTDNIDVQHLTGYEMQQKMKSADIVSLFVKPHEYRLFASPVKLYEYIGQAKPIIATRGALAGEVVEKNGLGWTLPYSSEALIDLLSKIRETPGALNEVTEKMRVVAVEHTWQARAQKVIEDLSK